MVRIEDFVDEEYEYIEARGGCHECPRKLVDHVPPTERDTKLLAVGEAPGKNEVKQGEGFVGSSGKRLRRHLDKHGIDPEEDVSYGNTILCRPPEDRTPNNTEVRCCLNQFVAELVEGYPVVALIGSTATKAFFPGKKFKKLRGNGCRHPDFPGQVFYPMYHPAWVGYQDTQEADEIFDEQVARLARIVRGDRPDIEVHRPPEDGWLEGLEETLQADRISFDIETNDSLRSWALDSRMVSFALTANGRDVYYCHEDDLPWTGAIHRLGDFFTRENTHVVGHNIGFDLEWVEREGDFKVMTRFHHDTQVLYRHLRCRGRFLVSLKQLVSEELDGYRYLVPEPGEDTDPDLLGLYNAEDVVYPLRLLKEGFPKLTPGQRDLYLNVAGPSTLFLRRMSARGIDFDEQKNRELEERLIGEREEIVENWKRDDPDFEVGFVVHLEEDGYTVKDNELREYLYDRKGLPVPKETDSGKPSTDKEALYDLIENYGVSWLDYLRDLRGVNKHLSTFVQGIRKRAEFDGRVHSRFLNTWTNSGRTSSRDPNQQNIPRDDPYRRQFTAAPGWLFVEADYSQVEFRVMMSQSEDPAAIEAYERGEDVHAETARQITGRQDYTYDERTQAKAVNFALLYGGDYRTLQKQARLKFGLEFSDSRAQTFTDTFFHTYRTLEPFHEEIKRDLRENEGYVEQVVGHRQFYPNWNHDNDGVREHCERQVINAQGQGPAAYITLLLGIEAEREVMRREWSHLIRPVSTVHDSVLFEVKEDHFHRLTTVLDVANQRTRAWIDDWFEVPLVLDVAVGPNWADAEELDEEQIAA